MTYACPRCGTWWEPVGQVSGVAVTARTCPDCERSHADYEDARADDRANGEGA